MTIDESGEGTSLLVAHTHALLLPASCQLIFLQRHDSTGTATEENIQNFFISIGLKIEVQKQQTVLLNIGNVPDILFFFQ